MEISKKGYFALKIPRQQWRAGSSPAFGTSNKINDLHVFSKSFLIFIGVP
jgi:hypothetical protein